MKQKKSKVFVVILSLVLLVSILAGCGGGNTGDTDSGATDQNGSGTPAAAGATKLSLTIGDPVNSSKAMFYQDLADKTREATNGGLDITIYAGGTLFNHNECLEGVLSGAADMGWFYTPWAPGQFPLLEVSALPMKYGNQYASTYALQEICKAGVPELDAELSQFTVINLYSQPTNYLCTTFPISTPADLKGKQLRCTAGGHAECLTAWGASPVSMAATEIYEAMDKGVIQGCVYELSGVNTQSLHEVLDYYVYIPMFAAPFMIIMNNDSYAKIPAEYKDAFDQIWRDPQTSFDFTKMFADEAEASRIKGVDEFGIKEITPDDAMMSLFSPAAENYWGKWLAANSNDGFDAQAYLDIYDGFYQKGVELYP